MSSLYFLRSVFFAYFDFHLCIFSNLLLHVSFSSFALVFICVIIFLCFLLFVIVFLKNFHLSLSLSQKSNF